MQAVIVLFVLTLCAAARAEDDDGLLDLRPPGEAIPERLQRLEREWADDVETQEPAEPPSDTVEEPHEPSPFEDDAVEVPPPHPVAEEPARAKPKSALIAQPEASDRRQPLREHPTTDAPRTGPPEPPKGGTPEPLGPGE